MIKSVMLFSLFCSVPAFAKTIPHHQKIIHAQKVHTPKLSFEDIDAYDPQPSTIDGEQAVAPLGSCPGRLVRQLRVSLGLSPQALAEQLGVRLLDVMAAESDMAPLSAPAERLFALLISNKERTEREIANAPEKSYDWSVLAGKSQKLAQAKEN